MKKCQCEHPKSFHPDKKSGLAEFGESILGSKSRACHGETNKGRPCPCVGFIEDE